MDPAHKPTGRGRKLESDKSAHANVAGPSRLHGNSRAMLTIDAFNFFCEQLGTYRFRPGLSLDPKVQPIVAGLLTVALMSGRIGSTRTHKG